MRRLVGVPSSTGSVSGALGCAIALAGVLAGCHPAPRTGPESGAAEIASLRAEVERLRRENADLRLSPHALAAEVDAALRAGNEEKALAAYKQLGDTFPIAPETIDTRRRLDAFLAARRAEEDALRRVAALGFKAVPVTPVFLHGDTSMTLSSTAVTRRWIFDSWGEGWRFLDAEKDRKLLVARLAVSSKLKEPLLPGVAAYVPEGGKLVRVGTGRYRFARWSSYGAFLGTQADFRNDFSHSWRVPFSVGIPIRDEDLRRGPVYLIATREGCHERHDERFGQPPVFYLPGRCETLKETLAPEDFRGGQFAILKRIE